MALPIPSPEEIVIMRMTTTVMVHYYFFQHVGTYMYTVWCVWIIGVIRKCFYFIFYLYTTKNAHLAFIHEMSLA